MQKPYIIYRVSSPDGKVYIGRTMGDLVSRRSRHEQIAARGSRLPFHTAIKKHQGAMRWEAIAQVQTKSELYALERHFIRKHNALVPNGYNMRKGDKSVSSEHDAVNMLRRILTKPRKKDGFVKITPFFQAQNRLVGDALRLGRTAEFVRMLSGELEQSPIIEVIRGGNRPNMQGVWVHPVLAVYLASAISPKVAAVSSNLCAETLRDSSGTRLSDASWTSKNSDATAPD